jgi:hypothetical protein
VPGGISDPIQGYLVFSAVKLAGYSLAGYYLNQRYAEATTNFAVVGITRTVIGMIFGAVLGLLSLPFVLVGGLLGILIYVLGLIPVRLLEWWIIIRWFYDPLMQTKQKDWRYASIGTAWSFALDIPAVIGLFATGGLWIC